MAALKNDNGVEMANGDGTGRGWAVAFATPFTSIKQVASDFGGTCNGTVIHWPKGIRG